MRHSRRAKRRLVLLAVCGVVALVAVGAAYAAKVKIEFGDLIVFAEGGIKPKTLPRGHDAPIEIYGGGRLTTKSHEYPPVIEDINLEFDKHGSVVTRGLEVCTAGKLQTTTVKVARSHCPGAIVGKGFGKGVVVFPEQDGIPVSSPITIFNGPRKGGNPTVFAHFYTTVPAPVAFVVPIVIKRIHRGRYGYRTEARIPPIAGGNGIPLSGHLKIDRKWTYKGKRYSYVNARCVGGRLQARGEFAFKGGPVLRATFVQPCKVRK
jgi:hypothetical protein